MMPIQVIFCITVYKALSLLVGTLAIYMGYLLFKTGIWGNAGDLETKYGQTSLVIKHGAPGTFFAVLGAIIISFTIYKGLNFEQQFTPATGKLLQPVSLPPNDPLKGIE